MIGGVKRITSTINISDHQDKVFYGTASPSCLAAACFGYFARKENSDRWKRLNEPHQSVRSAGTHFDAVPPFFHMASVWKKLKNRSGVKINTQIPRTPECYGIAQMR
jgi:hypothetical protein